MNGANRAYRLSEIESNQGIPLSSAKASPGHHCPMHTALATIKNINGVSSLVVGMPECSFYSRYVMDNPVESTGELHYTYVLDSNEVVFGCREGLIKALGEMEQDGAQAILVIMTCIPALIGEDILEMTETFSTQHKAKAVCIDLAHYKRNGYEAGYYEGYASLGEFCLDKSEKINQISILGATTGEEGQRLRNWLTNESYELVEIGARFHLDVFKKITQSKLMIVTHIHYLPLAKRIEKEHDIPYVFIGGAYSIEEVTRCYETIKNLLEIKEMPEFFELDQLKNMEESIQKQFEDSRFIITAVIEDALILTKYLAFLSMKPCFIHLEEYQPWMKEWKEEILAYSCDPYISYLVQSNISNKMLEKSGFLQNDGFRFTVGNIAIDGVACLQVNRFFLSNQFGYERTQTLLSKLQNIWKEKDHASI